jgi:hypothetical protein
MGEPIDFASYEMRFGIHEILIFRLEGEFIRRGCRIDMGNKCRMLSDVLNLLSPVIDTMLLLLQTPDIVFFRSNHGDCLL